MAESLDKLPPLTTDALLYCGDLGLKLGKGSTIWLGAVEAAELL